MGILPKHELNKDNNRHAKVYGKKVLEASTQHKYLQTTKKC